MPIEANIELYHNPRCSKSRATLALLEEYLAAQDASGQLHIRTYLDQPLSAAELKSLQAELGQPLLNLVRIKESVFSELGLSATSTEAELLQAVAENPILMERPVVRYQQQAAIGRPPENVLSILPPNPNG